MSLPLIAADWPAPPRVRAVASTRQGGVSQGPYQSLNVGDRSGDDPVAVAENRRRLQAALGLAAAPAWLRQVHGTRVVPAPVTGAPEADAAWTRALGTACAVLAADCLPVLFCDTTGTVVAAAHAGWRGLAAGILENTIEALGVAPPRLLAWLGPAIGPDAFEVGPEVCAAFQATDPGAAACFGPGATPDRFQADLYALARRRLRRAGLDQVYGGGRCTLHESEEFFSYRRDGNCGRQAALIWLED